MRIRFRSSTAALKRNRTVPAVLCFATLLLCTPGWAHSIPHPHRQPRQVVRIIQKLETRLQQAQLDANIPVMASLMSDDYLGIYADGTLATRTETLDDFKTGAVHYTSIDTFDRKIRVFGATAVVTSKARVSGVNHGETIAGLYRYTRVYHRANRVWKIVSFEASPLNGHHHNHNNAEDAGAA